ncbi:hypothetical protein [Clostridium botulinum]|uniref:hypothetical protein n=1 Tax=Clostridium botulinum TaxID=1491 RepID=UPI000772F389|nr:hypothetical protein [Clostridium botulinum]NFL39656.1 hypothetical protein [Clostridium botulinum]NFL66494.1 hypothetical protein [Clostridium botulinum]NFN09558.1 hypothetical protein [Clostridium botulinum]NFN26189.1 hypothetical protein [Clostridium botulinum]NFN33120.1 hypothetical protein [Clostridium botulinum]
MKLNELKPVLSASMISLNFGCNDCKFFIREKNSKNNIYLELGIDISKSMWDIYGERKIEKIYAEDDGIINIDLE